jgi:hypothetical protein
MRSFLLALAGLVVGALGALGYSHYLGEGRQLADLQAQLDDAQVRLVKVADESKQARSETDAMSAQIQQLTSTKDDLQHQLDTLKASAAAPDAAAPPAAPTNAMAGMIKDQMAQHYKEQLQLLIARLHLTPDQVAKVQAAMDEEGKRAEAMAAKMFAGGKVDPQNMADLKNIKSVDQTLNDILTPDQKTDYQQMKTDQKTSAAETMATVEMNQISPLLQLSDAQKDQVSTALMQVQLNSQDPTWIKNNMTTGSTNPNTILEAQAKAKEDALSKILTPDQMTTYQQQAQAQLKMQEAMMQKFMPAAASSGATVTPAATPASP